MQNNVTAYQRAMSIECQEKRDRIMGVGACVGTGWRQTGHQ